MKQLVLCIDRWLALTLGICVCLLALLEFRFQYYFLQDDGLEYYLPAFFHSWRSVLSGELPLYNWHTFAGVPHASMGSPAVFYLPNYLGIALSQILFGHPFGAIDLIAAGHAVIAVAGTYVLLKHSGLSKTACCLGSLTALSGFLLWIGRLWVSVTFLCAWFPWMVWASMRYLAAPSASRAGWVLFFRCCLLYAGHSQFFVLALLFEHLFAITWFRASKPTEFFRRCGRYVALNVGVALLGLAFILPLTAEVQRSLMRAAPLPYAEYSSQALNWVAWIYGQFFVFLPVPRVKDLFLRVAPFLSHIGYVPAIASLASFAIWRRKPQLRPLVTAAAFCCVVGMLWSFNAFGPVIYHVPLFNRFRWLFKLVYFGVFFQCVLAAVVISHWQPRTQRIALAVFVANWIWVFLFLPAHSWRVRDYHPPLRSEWQDILQDGRYLAIGGDPIYKNVNDPVGFDYALLFGLDSLMGYEPMISRLGASIAFGDIHTGIYDGQVDDELVAQARKWSVRYLLVNHDRAEAVSFLNCSGFTTKREEGGWTLLEDSHFLPLIRAAEDRTGLPGEVAGIHTVQHVNSLDMTLEEPHPYRLTLAYAANPGLETCIDEKCDGVQKDESGLISVQLPRNTKRVSVKYRNELLMYSTLFSVLALVGTPFMLGRMHSLPPA